MSDQSQFIKSVCCDAPIETDDRTLSDVLRLRHIIRCISCGRLIDYYDDEAQHMMQYSEELIDAGPTFPLWTWETPGEIAGISGGIRLTERRGND